VTSVVIFSKQTIMTFLEEYRVY